MTQYERPQGNEPYYDGDHLIIPGDFEGNPISKQRSSSPPPQSGSNLPDLYSGGSSPFSMFSFNDIPPATGRADAPTETFTPDFSDQAPRQRRQRPAPQQTRAAKPKPQPAKSSKKDDPYGYLFEKVGAGPIVTDTEPAAPAPEPPKPKVQVRTPVGRPGDTDRSLASSVRPVANKKRHPVRTGLLAIGLTAVTLSGAAFLLPDEEAPGGQDPLGLIAPSTIRPTPAASETESPDVNVRASTPATKRKPAPRLETTTDTTEPPKVVVPKPRPRPTLRPTIEPEPAPTYEPPKVVPLPADPPESTQPPADEPWNPGPEPTPSITLTPSPTETSTPWIEPPVYDDPPAQVEPPVVIDPHAPVEPPAAIEPPQQDEQPFWKKWFEDQPEPEVPPAPAEPADPGQDWNDDRGDTNAGQGNGNGKGNGNGNNKHEDKHNGNDKGWKN